MITCLYKNTMPRNNTYTEEESVASKRYSSIKQRVKSEYDIEEIWPRSDFIKWYLSKEKICCYCGCNTRELHEFYQITKFKRKKTRGKALEIERKSDGKYCPSNCDLCCHWCNNAKSDVFSYDEFLNIGKVIGDVIRSKISKTANLIFLSYEDTSFDVMKLVSHLKLKKLKHIIIGQQHARFKNHTKKQSLDYWIRNKISRTPDTAQATAEVVNKLCESGYFYKKSNLICPDTGRKCNGLILK